MKKCKACNTNLLDKNLCYDCDKEMIEGKRCPECLTTDHGLEDCEKALTDKKE